MLLIILFFKNAIYHFLSMGELSQVSQVPQTIHNHSFFLI